MPDIANKQNLTDLAVLGGPPLFAEQQHVGRPNVGDRAAFLARVEDILDRRWFTNGGPYVQSFEKQICELTGARHCVAMCNATIALEIAIRALDLSGEVIVPSFTFIATSSALQWQEITPVYCDVDPATHNLDPARVEAHITPRTTGIIAVHVWGRPAPVEALAEIARRRGLRLLLDAAHGFACSHRGTMLGNFGEAEVFSFHATKFLNTFEGGAVVTNNDELAAKMRLMRNFGFQGYDNVTHLGTNGKMCEVSAAMGVTSLESLSSFVAVNHANYHAYRQALAGIPGIELIRYDESERCNFQYVIGEVDSAICGITRDELVRVLHAENVLARRYFYPGCHRMEPFRSFFPHASLLLPETERLTERVLSLPTGTALDPEQATAIGSLIRFAIKHGADLSKRLESLQ